MGALFFHNVSGGHFCTASVVDSPSEDLIMTAAHCVSGSTAATDLVFVPDYQSGQTPHGIWPVEQVVVDLQWMQHADPDYDVAFATVAPVAGKHLQQVVRADGIAFDQPMGVRVRVTGYPNGSTGPITCVNDTTAQSPTQRRLVCRGYAPGTSGSPWISGFDAASGTGTIVGLIGGYQDGGNTSDVSYSPYFGAGIRALYDRARALR